MTTTPLPKPANAYEACHMAANMIATNPWAYYQAGFCVHRSEVRLAVAHSWNDLVKLDDNLNLPENVCGSAYCRIGWVVTLAMPAADPTDIVRQPTLGHDWVRRMRYLFGIDYDAWMQNVGVFVKYLDEIMAAGAVGFPYGSEEYALEGARGLRAFTDAHRERLEAITFPLPQSYAAWRKIDTESF